MGHGEHTLVNRLNRYFEKQKIRAFAYRNPQIKGRKQFCDINVDSRDDRYFLAVEVKAIRGMVPLNFKSHFEQPKYLKNGKLKHEHQLIRICEYADKTGRIPIIYMYVRLTGGRENRYTFDAYKLLEHMQDGNASLSWKLYDEWNVEWFDTGESMRGKNESISRFC